MRRRKSGRKEVEGRRRKHLQRGRAWKEEKVPKGVVHITSLVGGKSLAIEEILLCSPFEELWRFQIKIFGIKHNIPHVHYKSKLTIFRH